jgi:hypothetical protein
MEILTFEEKQKNGLIKKFHTLLGKAGIDNSGKEAILWSYSAQSTSDLTVAQLIDVCGKLDEQLNPSFAVLDKHRKRLMAAIGGWLRSIDKAQSAELIKGIACRASGHKHFNQIPKNRLISLYNAFLKMKNDMQKVEELTMELLTINN